MRLLLWSFEATLAVSVSLVFDSVNPALAHATNQQQTQMQPKLARRIALLETKKFLEQEAKARAQQQHQRPVLPKRMRDSSAKSCAPDGSR
jgi:hypothetical protein